MQFCGRLPHNFGASTDSTGRPIGCIFTGMSKDEGLLFGDTYRNASTRDNSAGHNARNLIMVLGIIALAVGGILLANGMSQLSHDQDVGALEQSLAGGFNTVDVSGDWWLIGAAIGVLVLGAILLVSRLIIAAARQ